MHTQPPVQLKDITGEQVRESFTNSAHNAGGMDGCLPAEMALLSNTTYDWIATLLNCIEQGAPWPEGQTNGRLAYLATDPGQPFNHLAYRLLTRLPNLYRRWASIRLQDLAQWA